MDLINLHTKAIMEGCKERARDAGLTFQDETLEYIVSNRDLLELSPKGMIPTLYDYWVHDVEVLKEKGKYELYPTNPYETVINTRPPISFYNDNNPDWLNVMIFYHVLAHIDFFQSNFFYRHTWDYDFTGQALSDKRVVAKLRAEKGRWVDYVIEFTRGIDNLVGFHRELSQSEHPDSKWHQNILDYYFDVFLQSVKKVSTSDYIKEINRYNESIGKYGDKGEENFFLKVKKKYPEFEALHEKHIREKSPERLDLIQFLSDKSEFLQKEENRWMKTVMEVVRKTSLFFQPQIRTKIMNEGWASYWHETLFLKDDRIKGHEVDFARINAGVTAMPKVGLNSYALGMRLFYYIEKMADKGKFSHAFQRIKSADQRDEFDAHGGKGKEFIFWVRKHFCDFIFINSFIDQDFININKLFVTGKRLNEKKMVWEYYIKSRKLNDYRQMLFDHLYHPPHIEIDRQKSKDRHLYLVHLFENKPLVAEFIPNTMAGVEYLWGGPVSLETTEAVFEKTERTPAAPGKSEETKKPEIKWERVVYTMENRIISKRTIESP
ncbi:MAG: SpoVR family protein [Deltaproteobacteria bacterium RBG_13_49_15]|nr:MAG: SpoVR family protein [Deltaproteobacteria bacterium RBG_13_49_15]